MTHYKINDYLENEVHLFNSHKPFWVHKKKGSMATKLSEAVSVTFRPFVCKSFLCPHITFTQITLIR